MSTAPRAPIFESVPDVLTYLANQHSRDVVLANGCFDPLHVGHVRYLQEAAAHGDSLVVAINNDASTRSLKGEGRPVISEQARASIVASLHGVSAVLLFGNATVADILRELRPATHAKGTDYTVESVPERKLAVELGINTVIVGDPKNHASTDVLNRLRDSQDK